MGRGLASPPTIDNDGDTYALLDDLFPCQASIVGLRENPPMATVGRRVRADPMESCARGRLWRHSRERRP